MALTNIANEDISIATVHLSYRQSRGRLPKIKRLSEDSSLLITRYTISGEVNNPVSYILQSKSGPFPFQFCLESTEWFSVKDIPLSCIAHPYCA